MIIKYSVRFFLHYRGHADVDKRVPLRMRVTIRGQKPFDLPVHVSLLNSEFDPVSQSISGNSKESKEARRLTAEWLSTAEDIFNRYEIIEKRIPDRDEVKTLFLDNIGRVEIEESLVLSPESAWDMYIDESSRLHTWSKGTIKKQKTIKRHFVESCSVKDVRHIGEKHINSFVAHLTEKGMHNTTITKDYRIVRQWLMWCSKKGYIDPKWLMSIDVRLKDSTGDNQEIVYLTLDELKSVETIRLPNPVLDHVRDVFVFCCYTGLRFSDAFALTRGDVDGGNVMTITQKTTDSLRIELNGHAKAILDKYSRVKYENRKALPVYTNQEMNRKLKQIGVYAKLNRKVHRVYHNGSTRHDEWIELRELLTTHCARRTFVVTALTLGIPAEVVMRWTGHKNYESMKPYVAIVDSVKRTEMNKFDTI